MTETKFYLTENDRSRFQPLFINTGELKGFTYSSHPFKFSTTPDGENNGGVPYTTGFSQNISFLCFAANMICFE